MREQIIEQHLVKKVKMLGGEIRKCIWYAHRGAPDRFVMLPHRCFWVETKAPGGKLAPHQTREHARMRKYGQEIYVLWSIDSIDNLFNEGN